MKMSEAKEIIENLIIVVQRVRSMNAESGIPESVLSVGSPWLYGNKNILTPLLKLAEKENIEPMEFINIQAVVHNSLPVVVGLFAVEFKKDFPPLDFRLVTAGWEPE